MIFNQHSELRDQHAPVSPSRYHWINYDDEKIDKMLRAGNAAVRGTQLHNLASECIRLGVKLQGRNTIAMYVNDAIGYGMVPEQILFYSYDCFGTADAIRFFEKKNLLRIHDLKTGVSPASHHQLEVYAALFCLEYDHKPMNITIEMRIYQNGEAKIWLADPDVITHIMDRIVMISARSEELRREMLS